VPGREQIEDCPDAEVRGYVKIVTDEKTVAATLFSKGDLTAAHKIAGAMASVTSPVDKRGILGFSKGAPPKRMHPIPRSECLSEVFRSGDVRRGTLSFLL
jgi:hypothetical protein